MGTHTFSFPHDRPSQGHATNGNGYSTAPTRPMRSKSSWGGKHGGPANASGRYSTKWKIAIAAMTIIFLHMFSVNVLFPLFTHHTIGSAQESPGSLNSHQGSSKPTDEEGGIIRLLSETASSWTSSSSTQEPGMSKEKQTVLARYGDTNYRGEDVWINKDGLTNPFITPPNDTESAGDTSNIMRYKARTFNALYHNKCGNASILPYNGGTGREWVTTSRAWTKNFGEDVSKYRWCRGGSVAEVPELKQVLLLKSSKPRPKRAVTIVTQLSLERASMLEQQCSLWPHPISAVVYVPLLRGRIFSAEDGPWNLAPLDQAISEMKEMHERLSALPEGCVLDMEVVAEECCNKDIASMYPTNAVRNRALHLASTEVVLLLDADFVVDLTLARALEERSRYQELVDLLSRHKALVLPAFEAWDQGEWGKKIALDAVHNGKAYIVTKFMYNVVIGFHMSHYPQGHEKTNFWKWINSTEAYEVEYQIGFEPYIMMLKKYVPYYDERFRGYYWNKVQHLMHISMQNSFTYVIHPEAFVVHVPHRKPSTKVRTRRSGQKERNHVMFLEALEDMKHDRFVPVTGFPHLCLPPEMQRAAADIVTNEDQKEAFLKMATLVKKVAREELPGGGPLALARARGQTTSDLPSSEHRSEIASELEERARQKREAEAQDNENGDDEPEAEVEFAVKEARETANIAAAIAQEAAKAERIDVEEEDEDEGFANWAGAVEVKGAGKATSLYVDEEELAAEKDLFGTQRSGSGGSANEFAVEEEEVEEDDEPIVSKSTTNSKAAAASGNSKSQSATTTRVRPRPIIIEEVEEEEEETSADYNEEDVEEEQQDVDYKFIPDPRRGRNNNLPKELGATSSTTSTKQQTEASSTRSRADVLETDRSEHRLGESTIATTTTITTAVGGGRASAGGRAKAMMRGRAKSTGDSTTSSTTNTPFGAATIIKSSQQTQSAVSDRDYDV